MATTVTFEGKPQQNQIKGLIGLTNTLTKKKNALTADYKQPTILPEASQRITGYVLRSQISPLHRIWTRM